MAVSVLSILKNNLSASAVVTESVARIMRANWMSENITVVCSSFRVQSRDVRLKERTPTSISTACIPSEIKIWDS